MSECEKSVDFWVEELIKDTNPDHFDFHEKFISYMYDKKICGFGNWMWNNGHNVGLFNLQTKVNTYCVPQWISVKDRLPEENDFYLVYIVANSCPKNRQIITLYFSNLSKRFIYGSDEIFTVTHWQYLPEPPKESDAE